MSSKEDKKLIHCLIIHEDISEEDQMSNNFILFL